MTFVESITTCFSKYVTFTGRASRSEYWYFVLFIFLCSFVLNFGAGMIFGVNLLSPGSSAVTDIMDNFAAMAPTSLFGLAVFLPQLAASMRRLHDTGRSGWWVLVNLVPCFGCIILIVLLALPGQPNPNQYGYPPAN